MLFLYKCCSSKTKTCKEVLHFFIDCVTKETMTQKGSLKINANIIKRNLSIKVHHKD